VYEALRGWAGTADPADPDQDFWDFVFTQDTPGLRRVRRQRDADRDGDPQQRSDPDLHAGSRELHCAQDQDQFRALAHHHEEHERPDAPPGSPRGLLRVCLDAPLDVLSQGARHAVHPHDHGDNEHRRQQHQQALKAILADGPALE